MKPHEFQNIARQFRAGKISLNEFTEKVFDDHSADSGADPSVVDSLLARLRDRNSESHKGDYGRLLIVAGSPGMSGAAALTGLAALRCGAGLVTVATDQRCQPTVASFHPSLMTVGLFPETGATPRSYSELQEMVPHHDCVAVGPGLGTSEATARLVHSIVRNARVPVVVDADGLNCLGRNFDFSEANVPLVLTPHPGEMRRLMDSPADDRKSQEAFAGKLATGCRGVVVLKGHHTLVTDGAKSVTNQTGNPGMATAGSGDVLTGMIGALIGQGLSVWESAVLGCHLHGKAGDLAAKQKSQVAMISTDIIDWLPAAIGNQE